MIEKIIYDDQLLSIIIRRNYSQPGINFFTPNHFSQQLAYMQHPAGKVIEPHLHNIVPREVIFTQEVLILKRGRLRVDFYDENKRYLESRVLGAGDVILLAFGGHGFEALDEIEMIEIKQGPYAGDIDKRHFKGVEKSQIKMEV